MGFLSNLFNRPAPTSEAKAVADAGYAVLWNAESNASPDVDRENYLRAYQVSLWTQRCVEAIATASASVVMQLFDLTTEEEVEQHPLLATLRYVNSTDDLPWLIAGTIGYELLSGDAYWLLDRPSQPNAIWNLRPDWVSIKPMPGGVIRYEYKPGGKRAPQLLPEDCVIHFRQWNPCNTFYGQSTIQAAETSVNLDKAIREFNANFMKNAAVPAGLLSVEGTQNEDDKRAAREHFQRNYGGGKNAGRTLYISGGKVNWQQLGNLNSDGSYSTEAKLVREEVLATFAVPPVKVGLLDGATYANSKEQERIFWDSTILGGHVRQLLGRLNQDYVSRWEDAGGYELRPDLSKISALQEDRKEKFARLQPAVGGAFITPNEARAEVGLEPVDGGDAINKPASFGAGLFGNFGSDSGSGTDDTTNTEAAKVLRPFGARRS